MVSSNLSPLASEMEAEMDQDTPKFVLNTWNAATHQTIHVQDSKYSYFK